MVTMATLAFARNVQAGPQDTADVQTWVEELWPAAQARGISRPVFDSGLAAFAPDPEVAELAVRQPEHELSTGAYIEHIVTDERVAAGRQLAVEHRALLDRIETAYSVDSHVLLTIWGIESAYGTAKGSPTAIVRPASTSPSKSGT